MAINVLSVRHDRHGLSEVERVGSRVDDLEARLARLDAVAGVIVLSTCNRVEVLWEGDGPVREVREVADAGLTPPPEWDVMVGERAVDHVFRVAAGLNSMIVGEREVAGQLKRALLAATEAGHVSPMLRLTVDQALVTSRQVTNQTALSAGGRSVVAIGLDLLGIYDWSAARVAVVGTGSYAGATLARLRELGASDIVVHSASGRGAQFAARHGIEEAATLADALGRDVVVTCRGRGTLIMPESIVNPHARFLDLALSRDVDQRVDEAWLVIDLADIQQAIAPTMSADLNRANSLVTAGIAKLMSKQSARLVAPMVAELRDSIMALVDDEVARLPHRNLTHEDAAKALRRLAARLLHVPSSRAHEAAEQGRAEQWLRALSEVYGLGGVPDADAIETDECPVTGLVLTDLESTTLSAQEA